MFPKMSRPFESITSVAGRRWWRDGVGGREGGIRTGMVVFAYTNHAVHWHVCLTMLLIHAALPM